VRDAAVHSLGERDPIHLRGEEPPSRDDAFCESLEGEEFPNVKSCGRTSTTSPATATTARRWVVLASTLALLLTSVVFASVARAGTDSDVLPPAISSDKMDYAPGEAVTLSGSNWMPGESVHVVVNDDDGQTWRREVELTADDAGRVMDQFNLPDWFVATYSVVATGPASGTATTTFSDGNLEFQLATADQDAPSTVSWRVTWNHWQGTGQNPNSTCASTPDVVGGTTSYNGNGLASGSSRPSINGNASAKPTGAQTLGANAGLYVLGYWTNTAAGGQANALTDAQLCTAGVNGSQTVRTLYAHFELADSTAPSTMATATKATSPASAYAFGDWSNKDVTVTLSATDNAGGSGVDEVRYTLDGSDPTASAGTLYAGPFAVSLEGATTLKFRAFDNAGNAESIQTRTIKVDKIAPTIGRDAASDSCSAAGSGGWCRGTQTAGFTASDSGSGLADSSQSSFTRATASEGFAVQIASGAVADVAGNVNAGIDAGPFKIDATDPSVTVSLARPPDQEGWYNAPVGYSISAASDDLSGVDEDTCDAATTYSGPDGNPVTVGRSCQDNAGNSASGSASFKYDGTPSSSQASSPQFNNGPTIQVDYSSADAASDLSGLGSVELWVKGPSNAEFHLAPSAPQTTASGGFLHAVDEGEGSYRFYTIAVDQAGNRETTPATADATTLQDETPPVTTDDAPSAWTNSSVTVTLDATDGGSGVAETLYKVDAAAYALGASVVVDAPADHSNDGVHTIRYYSVDGASNAEAVRIATVRIDTIAPTLTDLGPSPASPDGNGGWYLNSVTNRFQAADSASGLDGDCVAAFPADASADNVNAVSTGSNEGAAVTISSGPCSDAAGNSASGIVSAAFKIDLTEPSMSLASRLPVANGNGWNKSAVTVTWDCEDSVSGPVTAQVSDTKSDEGVDQIAHGICEDIAGNTSADSQSGISIDKTKPVISGGGTPAANGHGWNNTDVVVGFSCDDVGPVRSGISVDTVAGATLSSEGANQSVTNSGECLDEADNAADSSTIDGVSIDKSRPTISFVSRLPVANAFGWNHESVAVTWSCADQVGLSGVVAVEVVDTVVGEGADQSASGTCEDKAGNAASASKGGISIDKTEPSIAIAAPANGQSYKWNTPVAASYSCSDGLSGTASCSGDVANGVNFVALPVGSKSFSVSASDRAGNAATSTSLYSVIYDFLGLFQPIDMGANVLNSVKAGSAVPVKFKLGGNAGMDVFHAGSPSSVGITCSSTAVIDALEETLAASTSGLQYDAAADQYVYVWKTTSSWANSCRQLKVVLKDGKTVTANFKFK
jgi:hypothetical protein